MTTNGATAPARPSAAGPSPRPPPANGWGYTLEELADILRMSPDAAGKAVARGDLPGRKLSRRWYVPIEGLARWMLGGLDTPQISATGSDPSGVLTEAAAHIQGTKATKPGELEAISLALGGIAAAQKVLASRGRHRP